MEASGYKRDEDKGCQERKRSQRVNEFGYLASILQKEGPMRRTDASRKSETMSKAKTKTTGDKGEREK